MKFSLILPIFLIMSLMLSGCGETKTVTDTDTQTDTQVSNQAPNIHFESDLKSTTISFDATGSIDIDGEIVSYQWYANNQLVSESISGTFEVLHNGLNFLYLEITDNEGLSSRSNTVIYDVSDVVSNNMPPMINQIISTNGTMARFDASKTIDDTDDLGQLAFVWKVDGVEQSEAALDSIEFSQGNHTYELLVTDTQGLTASTGELNFSINQYNHAPIGGISVTNQQLNYIKVEAVGVVDLDSDEVSYHWDFGDGGESTSRSAVHQYKKAGIYTIILKLSDATDTTVVTQSVRVIPNMAFVPVADNIIANGDLEAGLTHWDKRGDVTIELSDEANSGKSSVKVSGRSGNWEGVLYKFDEVLTQGNEYEFYAWVKLAENKTEDVILTMHYVDAKGTNYVNMDRTTITQKGWSLLHGTFEYYAQGVVKNMFVYVESPDPDTTYYVDDLAVTGVIDTVLPIPTDVDISVDVSETHQFIDGFGATTPMWNLRPWTKAETQKLVGTGEDELGLSIIRTNISPNPDEWGAYASMLANADSYSDDLQILGTPWSPPAHMKDNKETVNGGRLLNEFYSDYASHLNNFVIYMKSQDVTMDVISVQNEPDFHATFDSCEWTGQELLDFVKGHANRINDTKVLVGESLRFNREFTDPVLNNDKALSRMEIVGGHLYSAEESGYFTPYPLAKSKGVNVWMTEWFTNNADSVNNVTTIWGDQTDIDVWNETLDQVLNSVHKTMVVDWNAYIWWWAKRYYSFIGDAVPKYGTANGEILKRGWAFSHYSKFVRPGALRVKAEKINPALGLDITAYQKDGQIVLVILNRENTNADAVTIGFAQNIDSAQYYNTSQHRAREKMDILVNGQKVELNIGARSISTVVLNY